MLDARRTASRCDKRCTVYTPVRMMTRQDRPTGASIDPYDRNDALEVIGGVRMVTEGAQATKNEYKTYKNTINLQYHYYFHVDEK